VQYLALLTAVLVCFGAAPVVSAQNGGILPLAEVKPGMKAVGKTVFSGNRIEEFGVEVLGVLENLGPRQSVILARLSGGPLEKTGVMQGMSGSPVYVGNRLMGAVALSFPFSKEPIAGIRPIEEMLQVTDAPAAGARRAANYPAPGQVNLAAALPKRGEYEIGPGKLAEISTPMWMSGFSRGAFDFFAPALRAAGLEPVQGLSGGGKVPAGMGAPQSLLPGSMISVQLVTGDLNVGADGTITHVDGKNVYAFGHRFLSVGATDMPFARSEVVTLLPNLSQSFKISTPREWMGSITQDRSAALAGELGRRAAMTPVRIKLNTKSPAAKQIAYSMEMVNDRLLTPLLLQMAVFSAIDATERTVGQATYTLSGEIQLDGGEPVRLGNVYSGDLGTPQQISAGAAAPLSYLLQSGFDSLKLKGLNLEISVFNEKKQYQIDSVWTSQREVRPGESFQIHTLLIADNGQELTRTVTYQVPIGAPVGPLSITVADGTTANVTDYRQFLTAPPKSAAQLLSFLNGLRGNTKGYIRLWRPTPAYQVQGDTISGAPPSLALLLARSSPPAAFGSKVAELEFPAGDYMVNGAKTVQVEVKEQ